MKNLICLKAILCLVFFVTLSLNLKGQQVFEKIIQTKCSAYGKSIIQTSDGGFAIASIKNDCDGQYDAYIIRTDDHGNILWTKTFGQAKYSDNVEQIINTDDKGFALIGTTMGEKDDVWVVKIDSSGNLNWSKKIGERNWEKGCSIFQTSEGNFIIAGYTNSIEDKDAAFPYNILAIKLDSLGNVLWNKNFGRTEYNEYGRFIIESCDNFYYLVGWGEKIEDNNTQLAVLKLDADGSIVWHKYFGVEHAERGYCIRELSDSTFVIAARQFRNHIHGVRNYIVKMNASGDELWSWHEPDFERWEYLSTILIDEKNIKIFGGEEYATKNNLFLKMLSLEGDLMSTNIYEYSEDIFAGDAVLTRDRGIATCNTKDLKVVFSKMDSNGCLPPKILCLHGEKEVTVGDTIPFIVNSWGARKFNWNCDKGTIVSEENNDTVFAVWDTIGNDVMSVSAVNNCGRDTFSYALNILACVEPSFSTIECSLQSDDEYFVNIQQGKRPFQYHWEMVNGSILEGQGTNRVQTEKTEDYYRIKVTVSNDCGIKVDSIDNYQHSTKNVYNKFFQITPNPITDNEVCIKNESNSRLHVSFFSLKGSEIKMLTIKPFETSFLDVSSFPMGIILYEAKSGENTLTGKLIKQ